MLFCKILKVHSCALSIDGFKLVKNHLLCPPQTKSPMIAYLLSRVCGTYNFREVSDLNDGSFDRPDTDLTLFSSIILKTSRSVYLQNDLVLS